MKRDYTLSGDIRLKNQNITDGVWVLTPEGMLDSSTALEFKNALGEFLEKNSGTRALLLDAVHVPYISSMGLGVLLETFKKMKEAQALFLLYDPQISVRRVLEISKLDFLVANPQSIDAKHPFHGYILREEPKRHLLREERLKEHEKKSQELFKNREKNKTA